MSRFNNKIFNSFKWTTLNTIVNALSAPIYQIFLSNYLTPTEFAYIAAISLITTLGTLILDIGYGEAIIQKKNLTSDQLSSLMIFNLLLSFVGSISFYYIIILIESMYKLEALGEKKWFIISFLFFSTVVIVHRAYLQKNMLFKEYSVFQIIKNVTDMVVSAIFIVKGFGIEGYLIGSTISSFVFSLLMIFFINYKTEFNFVFNFKINHITSLLSFSISIYLKNVLTFITKRIDEIIIGSYFSSESLGIYYFGKRLILQVQSIISNSFSQLLLPVFSKMNKDTDLKSLKKVYFKVTFYSSLISLPIFLGMSLFANQYVPIIFGEKWSGSAKVIEILSIAMIFQVLTANIATSLLYSQNKAKSVLIIDFITSLVYLSTVALFGKLSNDINFVLYLFTAYIVIKTVILQIKVGQILNYSLKTYVFSIKKIIQSALLMIVTFYLLDKILIDNKFLKLIFILIPTYMVYLISVYFLEYSNKHSFINKKLKGAKK